VSKAAGGNWSAVSMTGKTIQSGLPTEAVADNLAANLSKR